MAAAGDLGNKGLVAAAFEDGNVILLRHQYNTDFSAGVQARKIIPSLDFPYGEDSREVLTGGGVTHLALSDSDNELLVAASGTGGRVGILRSTKQENFLSGEITLDSSLEKLAVDFEITGIAVSFDHRWLYLGDNQGRVYSYTLPALEVREVVQVSDASITAMTMLLGGISVLAGDSRGTISQLFPVRDENNRFRLTLIRQFEGSGSPVARVRRFLRMVA